MEKLIVKGAREHNLKNIDLEIPKNKLVVFTGLSGSGKSSLAFDTIYAEGQRRYVESLSSYARQFLGTMKKPDVDLIEGLSPAISIDQKSTSHNPRSTVGTVTEIYDYMRLLFARIGHPHCPKCGREIARQSKEQITTAILRLQEEYREVSEISSRQTRLEKVSKGKGKETKKPTDIRQDEKKGFTSTMGQYAEAGTKSLRVLLMSPLVKDRKGEYTELFNSLRKRGYSKVRIDGHVFGLDEKIVLIKTNKHSIDLIIDSISISKETDRTRLATDVEQALQYGNGEMIVGVVHDATFDIPEKPEKIEDHLYSEKFACPFDNISLSEVEPRIFSFNTPHGACPECSGLGRVLEVDKDLVFNNNLSINEGGILPFFNLSTNDTWLSRTFKTFCKENKIPLDSKLANLSDQQKQLLLYGTGDREYYVKGENRWGMNTAIKEVFRGIAYELKRRYSESESDFIKIQVEKYMRYETCHACKGGRLKPEALSVTINSTSIVDASEMSIAECLLFVNGLTDSISQREKEIGTLILREIKSRLGFLVDVGLDYLTLARTAATLAGGEAQRIRLASQIGSGLTGVLYVLDEPSIGLHQRDNTKLIETLKKLRDLGNTVLVVEHDEDTMKAADYIYDFGPGAGVEGGSIIAEGTVEQLANNPNSITGQYLSGKKKIEIRKSEVAEQNPNIEYRNSKQIQNSKDRNLKRLKHSNLEHLDTVSDLRVDQAITVHGATEHNLQGIDVAFPLQRLVVVTGVSGSGKSTLVNDILYHALMTAKNPYHRQKPGKFQGLSGAENVRNIFMIDQSPIGRTPRSNPITYTGAFTYIRELFASTKEAKLRGYGPGRFSFNVKGGRCEACEGEGQIKIEMQFLPDVYVTCEVCQGKQYNNEALEILFNGKNIYDVLKMSVGEALQFFSFVSGLAHKLQTLNDVGLSYIKLGQPAPTLSGGEAQRVKLASELSKRGRDAVYLLDEPTTGLHFADLEKLLLVLRKLVDQGNTVIVIEHNLDVIKNADYIIDLGPEGGEKGGQVVVEGTPQDVANAKESYTGKFLQNVLQ